MTERKVDHNLIRTSQAITITTLAVAFVLNGPLLAAVLAVAMLVSATVPPLSPFRALYRGALVPAGIVRPRVVVDNPEPHRFAQGVGGTLVGLGALAVLAGLSVLGWALAWVVIVLASLNLFVGWCAGCTMYYWLNRLGVPGFTFAPVEANR